MTFVSFSCKRRQILQEYLRELRQVVKSLFLEGASLHSLSHANITYAERASTLSSCKY